MNESSESGLPEDPLPQLAGEYVLGTLSLAARQAVERRLATEPQLRAEVAAWEQRLLPLTALAEPVEPSSALWPRITSNLAGNFAGSLAGSVAGKARPQAAAVVEGWRRWWDDLRLWRALAGGAVAATVVLATTIASRPAQQEPAYMVVLVAPQQRTAGYVVQASLNRQLTLTPLQGTTVPDHRALQFWTKGTQWKAPVSLGLVAPNRPLKLALDRLPPVEADQLFEITLEPEAGSPTGRPTGPVLYIGRAVKVM